MPTPPSTWYPGPLSPQQLNSDLYSYDGTGYGASGILFHSHRVLLHESMSESALWTVSTGGTWNIFANTATTAFSIIDTGALFGVGSDNPGGYARYQFTPNALGASGIGYTPGFTTNIAGGTFPTLPQGAGGYYLIAHFATGQTATTGPAAIGAGMYASIGGLPNTEELAFAGQGAIQAHTTSFQGCAPYIDIRDAGGVVSGTAASPVAYQQITSTFLPQGAWTAGWITVISATASSADANNFALVLGVSTIATAVNAGTIGTFFQSNVPISVTASAGQYLSVTAGAVTPTSATTYAAGIWGDGLPSIGNGYTFLPAGFYADASATEEQTPVNPADTAGFTPRHTWVWAGVTQGGTTVSQVPAPRASWSGPVTSAVLNGPTGIKQALQFLNNPPLMRWSQNSALSVPNITNTVVEFNPAEGVEALYDTYSGYSTNSGAYTAPLPGLYLAFAVFPFTANATGIRYAGFQVNSTFFEGPAYSAVTSATITSVVAVRVLDLSQGDTVTPICSQSSGGSLSLSTSGMSRFGMLYLCPYSSGGVLAFTPPLTSFHWYAGLPADQLPGFMNEHLGNDLNFLINRPYFTGYQRNAQSGLADGSWNPVTIDTPGGIVHGSLGDNYGGWNAAQNMYVAQQPGWYLVIAEVYGNTPSAATAYMAAGINCPSSGGVTPSTSPDQYQTVFFPVTTGKTYPGALAIGMYYMDINESVQPMIYANNWGGNYGTGVSTNPAIGSQFSVIWMAE